MAERLPIKLIMPQQYKEKRVSGGGSKPKPFRQVTDGSRTSLTRQILAIRDVVSPQIVETEVAPVRVKLLPQAAAKTHRPENLFSSDTCPIVGAGRLGELFIKATTKGLSNLAEVIGTGKSDQIIKEISSVEAIEAVTPSLRRKGVEPTDLLRKSPRRKGGFLTRVRLFNFGPDAAQPRLVADFESVCRERKISLSKAGYSATSYIYGAECRSVEDVDALSRVVGVRSIASMPFIRTLRPKVFNAKPLPKLVRRDEVTGDVPVVVVVDSGVTNDIPA